MTTSTQTEWPGEGRRHPPMSSATYVVRAPLAAWLQEEAASAAARRDRFRVLDVGCGVKPYYPFFAEHASEYVGVDAVDNPAADLRGQAEALPVADATFDLVLCIQVLEHCDDPAAVVRELRRVAAPGGRVLASTHGVQVFHPSPEDHWRWTHTGLERLFSTNGDWAALSIEAASGTASCLAMLLATFAEIGCRRAGYPRLARGPVWALNQAGTAADRRFALLRTPIPGALVANYHVAADVPA
jgi:SAM-dependent methyltransferase